MTTAAHGPGDRPRNTAEKSRRVCRHNGLFAAIPTVVENRDGAGQAVDRLRTRTRPAGQAWPCSHRKRDRPRAPVTVRPVLAPVPAEPGRGRARASAARVRATVPPGLYGAWRVAALRDAGAWETRDAAGARTCARSTRPEHVQALPGRARAAAPHDRPRGAGEARRHAPSWQGRAVRGGSPRTGVSLGARCARPREPVRARGARYALGAAARARGRLRTGRPPGRRR